MQSSPGNAVRVLPAKSRTEKASIQECGTALPVRMAYKPDRNLSIINKLVALREWRNWQTRKT
jgi:hypothetical protein